MARRAKKFLGAKNPSRIFQVQCFPLQRMCPPSPLSLSLSMSFTSGPDFNHTGPTGINLKVEVTLFSLFL